MIESTDFTAVEKYQSRTARPRDARNIRKAKLATEYAAIVWNSYSQLVLESLGLFPKHVTDATSIPVTLLVATMVMLYRQASMNNLTVRSVSMVYPHRAKPDTKRALLISVSRG